MIRRQETYIKQLIKMHSTIKKESMRYISRVGSTDG